MEIVPTGAALGARVTGIGLAAPLDSATVDGLLQALGRFGVLCFPGQALDPAALKAFSGRFGSLEINVAAVGQIADAPEVMVLSNRVEDGKPVGLGDAGQGWHTDMSYSAEVALATVLHARQVPHDDAGAPLGNTEFADMHAAYDALPADVKARLDGATATHDFEKFWEMMRARPGSRRAPLSAEQRRRKPPVSHPLCPVHPVTGRRVLYADPGYVTQIDGLPRAESDEVLAMLFDHQQQPEFRYAHRWCEGDVLMWDELGTIHNAVADYGDRPRYMLRCQVMADRVGFG
jgi:taurine dioxygenase